MGCQGGVPQSLDSEIHHIVGPPLRVFPFLFLKFVSVTTVKYKPQGHTDQRDIETTWIYRAHGCLMQPGQPRQPTLVCDGDVVGMLWG